MDNMNIRFEDVSSPMSMGINTNIKENTTPITVSKLNNSENNELKNEILDPSKYNYQAYWENEDKRKTQQAPPLKPALKKPEVTYDDILSSLNVTVQNGKLQLVNKNNNINNNKFTNPHVNTNTNQNSQPNIPKNNQKKVQIDPQLKDSKIYNKYFKNYYQEQQPDVIVFETKEDYMNYQREQYIKQLEQAKRISQIKSKKLLFDSPKISLGISRGNNLRKFSFH